MSEETQAQKGKHHMFPHTQMVASETHIFVSIYKSARLRGGRSGTDQEGRTKRH